MDIPLSCCMYVGIIWYQCVIYEEIRNHFIIGNTLIPRRQDVQLEYQGLLLVPKVRKIRVFHMMCPGESKKTLTCYNVRQMFFLLFEFQQLKIMILVTHLGYLSYKLTTSSVILVSSLDLTSRINIIILDLLSQIYNQLHSLIRYLQLHISSVQFFQMYERLANINILCFISYLS